MPSFAIADPDAHGRPDPAVTVRPARSDDAAGVRAVAATRGPLPDDFVDRASAWITDSARRVVVAERDGAVVGWAMLARWAGHDDAPDGWYVSALTVVPGRRRRGIGDRLLTDVLTWADARGAAVHSVVNAGNDASLALHRAHGFAEVGRAATYAGIEFDGGTGVLLRRSGARGQT